MQLPPFYLEEERGIHSTIQKTVRKQKCFVFILIVSIWTAVTFFYQ